MTNVLISQVSSLIFLAFAISMDAFSISLSYGLHRPRLRRILQLSIFIGLFHMLLPFVGMMFGHFITAKIGQLATLLGGFLLLYIGLHMFFSSFTSRSNEQMSLNTIAMISLAFVVSIDSFSIGLSLGMSGVTILVTLVLFGGVSMMMTMMGLLLGRRMNRYIGIYSEILGAAILTSFGLHILFW